MSPFEHEEDTIVAVSTPPGEGGLGVVRLSGRDALQIAARIFRPAGKKTPPHQEAFKAQYGRVVDPRSGKVIDEALLLVMRAPKSYTCEDTAEISAHGSAAVLHAIVDLALREGARAATPGEFTKRAFMNGRLDLVQAEAVLDLIRSKTDENRRWALAQLEGGFSRNMDTFKKEFLEILSHVEAAIDFPDDLPDTASNRTLADRLEAMALRLRRLLEGSELRLLVKRGLKAVIFGSPNVGKSSLMNRLVRQDRVIVTAFPGTTRDVVEEEIQIRDIPLRLFDTAGIHESAHPIEKEGIERSRKALEGCDLSLLVLDASQPFGAQEKALAGKTLPDVVVLNKRDLPAKADPREVGAFFPHALVLQTSCVSGEGIAELEEMLYRRLVGGARTSSDENLLQTSRQKECVEKLLAATEAAVTACRENRSPELIASDVRACLEALGQLLGDIATDEMLDRLFSQFCIGK